ncbi:sulfatase-like hydrolase/transferase [Paenibacillus sp. IB182496]|uniref:Sulfatase-like hydrolase/transferase n=1 Tax=Paenibacillus sabuli TaxID=2772509 RepID=A0A927GU73_9BACL|nr:sulfatase-like hydrolase/transferase [Paenibacillus sabuli]MBD2848056.1 sulfatase-like hydrolase/transferase [Paenibacillus sabuli]
MAASKQPNILVLMTDEQSPQVSEVYGHPYVKTPNMQRLAESGVVFDQAYSDSPLCTPQRASFMTGLQVHRHEVWDNGVPLRSDIPTFAHMLTYAGYETILSGKMHFVGADQLHGFHRRLTPDCNYPGIVAQDWDKSCTPFPGGGTGVRLQEAGPRTESVLKSFDDQVESQSRSYLQSYADGDQEKPFALVSSFIAPHFPLTPSPEYFELYKDIATLPEPRPDDASPDHPAMERLRAFFNFGDVDPETLLRARAALFGLITETDARIGRLLDTIAQLDLSRPTVIIFTSDHGDMMGEHELWWKSSFYEESVRVPLIISCTDPTWFKPHRQSMPVTLIDVTRTIIGLSGSDADTSELDGMDLTPILQGGPAVPDRLIRSQYHAHGTGRSMAMVRQGRYKLNYVAGEPYQLFDLQDDPHEWYDRSQDPALRHVSEALLPHATAGWPEDIEDRVKSSLKKRKLIQEADQQAGVSVDELWIDVGADRGWSWDTHQ